jgi:hypothetical protein
MDNYLSSNPAFEANVTGRFGILPNFFRSARAAPDLVARRADRQRSGERGSCGANHHCGLRTCATLIRIDTLASNSESSLTVEQQQSSA